jgi:Fe-S cluster biogenesis protein NfuA
MSSTAQGAVGSTGPRLLSECGHEAAQARQTVGVPEISDEERARRLVALTALIDLMRPAVQSDGGDLVLVRADVETGVVEVQLQGACSSCAISSTTLQGGVERILTDRLDWVTEVVGGIDDSLDAEDSMAMGSGGYVPRYRQL